MLFRSITPTTEQLAREACEIEISILGKPIGIQDQYIAAYGGLRYFKFGPGKDVKVESLSVSRHALEDLDIMLMSFFTGQTRKAAGILSEQKANIAGKIPVLQQMAAQARQVRSLLETGDVEAFGRLLQIGRAHV